MERCRARRSWRPVENSLWRHLEMAQNGSDLTALSATEAAARIAAGELTSVELVTALLEQIEEREPAVEAWQHVDTEEVRAAAALRDKKAARGPLQKRQRVGA